jgi:transcriptional regulator with XRE-family HTH domain
MTHESSLETAVRSRLRSLRQARGWTIEELARRSDIGASTISRLETGERRLAIDNLVALSRALDTTVDALLAEGGTEDVMIRPTRHDRDGVTYWLLTPPDDTSGRIVSRMRLPARKRMPPPRVHPGHDWLYVLDGTVRLQLGERELLIEEGCAASFDTMTPHSLAGLDGPAEILTILDHHGQRAHLHDR